MDATLPVAIIAAGAILKAPAEDFLKRISGPAGDDLGLLIRDRIRDFRSRNIASVTERAQAMLDAASAPLREVPLRTLLPLLDGASVEDDEILTAHWASLLANAANETATEIPPIFPAILRQLTPLDAKVLTRVSEVILLGLPDDPLRPRQLVRVKHRWGARREELALDVSSDRLEVAIVTLTSLGLLEIEPVLRSEGNAVFPTDSNEIRLTPLGERFLRSCQAPAGTPPPGA